MLALCLCSLPASATVTQVSIQSPQLSIQKTTSVTSPVRFQATAESDLNVTGYVVYIDGENAYQNVSPLLDAWILLAPGSQHSVYITAWDSSGALFTTPTYTINVTGAAPPLPPLTAAHVLNLDQLSQFQWTVDNDNGVGGQCNDGSIGIFANSLDPNTKNSPDLDNSGQHFILTSACTYDDSLFTWKDPLNTQTSHTNFLWDFWIYIPNTTQASSVQAFEFDMFQAVRLHDGVHEFMFGSQCNYVTNQWQIWLPQNGSLTWVDTGLTPCQFSTGGWHHLSYFLQRVTPSGYQYVPSSFNPASDTNTDLRFGTLTVDGNTLYLGGLSYSTIPSKPKWSPVIGVQHQVDSAAAGVTIEEYIDKESLTTW